MGARSITDAGVRRVALSATALLVGSIALFWPGYATYDTVAQYGQVVSGVYDDWHPPAMARLWSLFGAHGTGPMFALQLALFWAGLGTLAMALASLERRRAAVVVLVIGVWPPVLGWQATVLKDAQMLGAMLAAFGLVAWWRLRGLTVPWPAVGAVVVLMGYAVLVRANAVFAVAPLAVMLGGWPRGRPAQAVVALVGMVAVLAVAPVVNHRLMLAGESPVVRTEAIYDLAGIAVRTGDARGSLLGERDLETLRAHRCVKPMFWDPLGDAGVCEAAVAPLHAVSVGVLYGALRAAVLRHPVAYAAHRLAHWNATERWLVPWNWPNAVPPFAAQPNDHGLNPPGIAAHSWQVVAGWLTRLPTSWPVAFVAAGLLALVDAGRAPGAARDLALALLMSALTLEASFAVVSIASDLRYHLWPMVAVALAVVLLADGTRRPHAFVVTAAAIMAVVLGAGTLARIVLPGAPQTYAAMVHER